MNIVEKINALRNLRGLVKTQRALVKAGKLDTAADNVKTLNLLYPGLGTLVEAL